MATNFGKRLWKLTAAGTNRQKAIDAATALSAKPAHRWIPGEQLAKTGYALITERQAVWMHFFWSRHSIMADFEPATAAEQQTA